MQGVRDIDQIDIIPQENKSNICHSSNAFILTHLKKTAFETYGQTRK